MADMPDFAHQPNALAVIQAVGLGQNMLSRQQTEADVSQAGQIAAGGDYDAATKYLMAHGHMDEANTLNTMMRTADADKAKAIADTHEKIGNLALLAKNPDEWGQGLKAAEDAGMNVDQYRDFTPGRQLALAMSGKAKDYFDQIKQERDAQDKALANKIALSKAQTPYTYTVPGTPATEAQPGVSVPSVNGWPASQTPDIPGTPATPEKTMYTRVGLQPDGTYGAGPAVEIPSDLEPMAAPGKTGGGSAQERMIKQYQDDFEKQYGQKLQTADAASAIKNGTLPILDGNGKVYVPLKATNQIANAKAFQYAWEKEHKDDPDFHPLDDGEAQKAAGIYDRNFGGTSIGFKKDAKGIPRVDTSGTPGTAAYARTEEGAEKLAEKRAQGSKVGQYTADDIRRGKIMFGADNHFSQAEEIAKDPEIANVLGPIGSNTTLQGIENAINAGRIKEPALWGNLKAAITVGVKEMENGYHLAGTGADTDARNKQLRESLENLLWASPNVEVLRMRLAGMRAIAKGFINTPTTSEIIHDKVLQDLRKLEGQTSIAHMLQPTVKGMTFPGSAAPAPSAAAPAAAPPLADARQAPDGKWYVPDQARPGKYLRVD